MTRARKVLHVLAPARQGGLERVVTMLAAGRGESGAHVAAVVDPASGHTHPFVSRLRALSVPATTVVVRGKSYWKEYRALKALISQLNPAVVHTHGYRADVIGGAAAKSLGVATVSTVHGFTGGGVGNAIYERIQTLALKAFDGVIAVSTPIGVRLEAAGVARGKIYCVPNGFLPAASRMNRPEARQRLGVGEEETLVGWVGRLSREKGADVMLEALALTGSSWRLSIIGDGPELKRLKRHAQSLGISGRVHWHGAIESAGSLFGAFDAFVLSSRTEGTPIALLEAMDAQVPIVATAVGGVPDVVGVDEAIVVGSEDAPAIARALEEIERNPAAAARRARAAKVRLVQAFGLTDWLAAIEEVYAAASARRQSE